MSRLNDILQGRYAPITITLGEKAHRFLAHLARIAGTTQEHLAIDMLTTQLALEAEILLECCDQPETQVAAPSMQEQNTSSLIVEPGNGQQPPPPPPGGNHSETLTLEDLENAAHESMQLLNPDET